LIGNKSDLKHKREIDQQTAIEFAKTAISLSINKDNSSVGGVRLVDITKDGYTRIDYNFNELPYQN